MRPSRPAQYFWRCIHHPSKRPAAFSFSQHCHRESHHPHNQCRTLSSTATRQKKSRSPFKSISQHDLARLTQSEDRTFRSYSRDDVQDLADQYTPEQLQSIALAEEAISDKDLVDKAKPRSDGMLRHNELFEDFSRIMPVIDKKYEKLYGEKYPYEKFKSVSHIGRTTKTPTSDEIVQQLGLAMMDKSPVEMAVHPESPLGRLRQGKNPDSRLERLWHMELAELYAGLTPLDASSEEVSHSLHWSDQVRSDSQPHIITSERVLSAWSSSIEIDSTSAGQASNVLTDVRDYSEAAPRDVLPGVYEALGRKIQWHSSQKAEKASSNAMPELSLNTFSDINETQMIRHHGPFGPYNADAFRDHNVKCGASKLRQEYSERENEEDERELTTSDAEIEREMRKRDEEMAGLKKFIDLEFLEPPTHIQELFSVLKLSEEKKRIEHEHHFDVYKHRIEKEHDQVAPDLRYTRPNVDDVEVWSKGELRPVKDLIALFDTVPQDAELAHFRREQSAIEQEMENEDVDPEDAELPTDPATVARLNEVMARLNPQEQPDVAPELGSLRDPEYRWISDTETSEEAQELGGGDEQRAAGFMRLMKQTGLTPDAVKDLVIRPLVYRGVVNQTRMGKVRSAYYLVVAGNRDGMVGLGEGKAAEIADAVRIATLSAIRSMRPIKRYENRTLFGEVKAKVGASVVELSARPPGFGLRVSHLIFEIARAAGIHDLSARTPRSRKKMNVCKATVAALHGQLDPEDVARARGRKLVDVRKVYYPGVQSSDELDDMS